MAKNVAAPESLKIATMVIGAVLLVAALVAAFIRETMTPGQVSLVHTVSSLAGGLVAVGIAGFISVKGTVAGLALRAGGPMAVTVFLFIVDPSAVAASAGASPERAGETKEIDKLKGELGTREVTLVEHGREVRVSGAEAVRRIAQSETGLRSTQVSRSATPEQLRRIRAQLQAARTTGRITIPPRPPSP